MDFKNELWSSESYSQLVLVFWILIYLMVCTFPILFLIAAAVASDRRFNSITKSPNFENEKLILKHQVRAELQFDYSLGHSTDAVSYLKHEYEECDSETNPKQVINSKDEHDSLQNQLNSPKSEQCFKENMVRAELQGEDLLRFSTDSVSRPHFMNDYEWGNSERNSNHVTRMPDEMDSDSSAYISSWNFGSHVSWDSFADASSDDDFVGTHLDGLYIKLCTENDHDMSLHQHKFEEEENKERSSGIRQDCLPTSNSEDNSALKGSQRGNMVELKSRKQQTNINPSIRTVLTESFVASSSLSHPQQHTVDAEDKECKNPVHPDYVLLFSRIDSYTGWPAHHIQTPQKMAKAGFFYTGSKDYTCCFQCGVELRNWEPGDNPWIEHARWYPHCTYVLGKKGQKFVNAVLSKVEQNTPLAFQNAQRSESSSMTTISTIRRPGTAFNLEFDSSHESGSQSDEKSLRKEWLRDRNTCRICKDSDRELRVLPCGHLECCEICLQALRFCPFC